MRKIWLLDGEDCIFVCKMTVVYDLLNYIFSPLTVCVLDGYISFSEHNFLPSCNFVLHGIA